MTYTRRAIGLLTRQYRSVLKKCFLINCGLFALIGAANATVIVDSYDDLRAELALASDADVVLDTDGEGISLNNAPGIVISENQSVSIQNVGTEGMAYWTEENGSVRQITNSGNLSVNNIYYENNVIQIDSSYAGSFIYNDGQVSKITNSVFSNNQTSTLEKTLWGGIINNRKGGKIDLIQNVIFDNNSSTAGARAPHGGVLLNSDEDTALAFNIIDVIDNVVFSNNTMTGPANQVGGAHGGGIDNNEHGIINKITNSVFKNNYIYRTGEEELSGNYHASAAALDNYSYIGEISNTLFEDNHVSTESITAVSGGGAVMNVYMNDEYARAYIGKMENVTFIHNYIETGGEASGGAIGSGSSEPDIGTSYIGYITGYFSGNYVHSKSDGAYGGAIDNGGYIGYIIGDFKGNYTLSGVSYAHGGAIYNGESIGDITGNFTGNHVESSSTAGDAQGGAVYQLGNDEEPIAFASINSLRGNFTNNYALSVGRASGGAISNNNITEIKEGIFGNFTGNYAKSTGDSALARGGAIISFGDIKKIEGKFTDNYAESAGAGAIGGALAKLNGSISSRIDDINADFTGNHATATGLGNAYGGAIYNYASTISSITGDFSGNYAQSGTGIAQGGAIWNSGTIGFAGTSSFSDNYVEQGGVKTPNDIYNEGTITLKENAVVNIGSGINGSSGKINLNSGSVLNLNASFSNNTLTADNAKVYVLENASFGDNVTLNINAGSFLAIEPAQITVNSATFAADSTLSLKVTDLEQSGVLYAKNLSIAPDETANMQIIVAQGVLNNLKGNVDIQILKADNDFENTFKDEFTHNNMYSFAKKEGSAGWYTITQTATAEDVVEKTGGTETEARAAGAWIDGEQFAEGSVAAEVANALVELAQNNPVELNGALSVIAPQDAPVVETAVTDVSDKLLLNLGNHLSGNDNGGLSSGDALQDVTIWAKGYYGKSKLSDSGNIRGFDAKNKGVIAGVDKKLDNSVKVGFGFQYNDSDIDAFRRDVDVDTITGFIYGEYRPSNWYVNGIASYGRSDYKEKKFTLGYKIDDKYNADTYSLQAVTGYDFKYVSPEIGARYYHIKRYGYEDSIGQKVSGSNMDLLRGVIGLRSSHEFGMFKPEIYVGMTYDIESDKDGALVSLPNGSSYAVDGKRLNRFGTEVNTSLTANLTDHASVTLGYEGKYREHYQDHTGAINLKYNF